MERTFENSFQLSIDFFSEVFMSVVTTVGQIALNQIDLSRADD